MAMKDLWESEFARTFAAIVVGAVFYFWIGGMVSSHYAADHCKPDDSWCVDVAAVQVGIMWPIAGAFHIGMHHTR